MGEPDSKVLISIEREDGTCDVETLWAESLGEDRFRLHSSPFYAYSVSWEDIVYAPFDPDQKFPTFKEIIKKWGNRTIRILLDPPYEDGNESAVFLNSQVAIGCSYEGANPSYISLNIPQEVSLPDCIEILSGSDYQWEHADPSYSELYPNE